MMDLILAGFAALIVIGGLWMLFSGMRDMGNQ